MTAGEQKDKEQAENFEIEVTRDGPYLVSGKIPLSEQIIGVDNGGDSHGWSQGKKYPEQEKCALCRCGQSKNKPFCDGTHVKASFNGTETASNEPYSAQAETIKGPRLTLEDAEALCAGARFCDRAGGVWDLTERSGNPQARETAIEEARDCPSGRLVVRGNDGKEIEPAFEPSIGLVEDTQKGVMGPIWVRGNIPVTSSKGFTYEKRNRVTLCRCGKSSNKPFCDASHLG
jgi:CDGSH-type Zn-finger protein